MGKYTGRRLSPTHDEIAQLAYSLYSHVAGRKASTSKISCGRDRNSYGTMRNCKGAGQYKPRICIASAKRRDNL